jgi:hypothetical protein
MSTYWKIFVDEVVPELGIVLTPEQSAQLLDEIKNAHENYSTAHGYDCIPNPDRQQIERLQKALKKEQEKRFCAECHGRGSITTNWANRSSSSQCWKCNGEGKL